jgi:hypothetical protein
MYKEKDYRTFNDKKYDFMYKHRIKIILFSFIYSLCVFFISFITSNRGGLYIIVLYPLALIGFIFDLICKYGSGKYGSFSFSIFAMIMSIISFILGFFVEI